APWTYDHCAFFRGSFRPFTCLRGKRVSAPRLTPMERLDEARAGSTHALGQVLEACRLYMLGIAERELDPLLRAKAGASDLVQQTFLEAQRDFGQFHGGTEDELLAWLRRLLLNNLANFARQYRGTHKRAVNREVRLPGQNTESNTGANIAGAEPTPSSAL